MKPDLGGHFVHFLADLLDLRGAQVQLGADLLGRVLLHEHVDDLVHVEVDQLDALLLDGGTESS